MVFTMRLCVYYEAVKHAMKQHFTSMFNFEESYIQENANNMPNDLLRRHIEKEKYSCSFFFISPRALSFIRPKNVVQEPDSAIIHLEAFVVSIMLFSCPRKEIVSAVHRRCLDELKSHKHPHGQDMGPQQQRRQQDWQDVCHEMLHGMGILRGESHGGGELVVRLVEAPVQRAPVEDAVRGVEEDLASEHADGDMVGELLDCGEARVDSDAGGTALGGGGVEEGGVEGEDDDLVADADEDGVEDVVGGGLFGGGLDLVFRGEGGRDGVEEDEEDARDPPEYELDDEGADEVYGMGIVGCYEAGPEGLCGVEDGHGHDGGLQGTASFVRVF